MIRVVLDTNVLVSGFLWKGSVTKIVEAWIGGKFDAVVSIETFEELRRILEDLGKDRIDTAELLSKVAAKALWVTIKPLPTQVCADPDDDKFIATAIAGRARYIVTGDKALLAVQEFHGVETIKPANFLSRI